MNHVIFDVDGVFNTGQFLYTEDKKFAKIFGPHDADGIKKLREHFTITAISADKRGFPITKKRIADDMEIELHLVTEQKRLTWLQDNFDLNNSIYMGDGYHDAEIFEYVGYAIAPGSACKLAKENADFVTDEDAGNGAVLGAALHILNKFKQINFKEDFHISRPISVMTNNDDLEHLYTIKNFPALISCTHKNEKHDIVEDLNYYICKKSGMIQINPLLSPKLIYRDYHSEALGKTWKNHHNRFIKLLLSLDLKDVYEIGGSNGYMAQEYVDKKPNTKWTLVDIAPSFEETDNIKVMAADFDDLELPKNSDIVHSHTLEHIFFPEQFMAKIHENLEIGRYHVFSVPDLKKYLANKYSNVLNFEHTLYLTEDFIDFLLKKYSFETVEKIYFENHSIMYVTRKISSEIKELALINEYAKNKELFMNYFTHFEELIKKYNDEIKKHDKYYLFGAHVFSQFLLAFGLNTEKLSSILDNSNIKEGKRLYGTNFSVSKPDVIKNDSNPLVLINAGQYQKEVEAQFKELNQGINILK